MITRRGEGEKVRTKRYQVCKRMYGRMCVKYVFMRSYAHVKNCCVKMFLDTFFYYKN